MRRSRTSLHRRGFTLLEIMVALVAGVITISVVYSLSRGTTRVLTEQHRVSQTQTALRLAMEQIRTDIERAGFGGSANSDSEPSCSPPTTRLQAVYFTDNPSPNPIPNAAAHHVDADRLILVGNYVTSGTYMLTGIGDTTGAVLTFQETWQSYRRDFGDPFNTSAFERAFSINRWVHVTTLQGQNFYTKITGNTQTTGAGHAVTISPVMTPGGLCTVGLADGATISPLNAVEYLIVTPTSTDASLSNLLGTRNGDDAARIAMEGTPSVLIRREVDPFDRSVIAGTTRVVLEWAVEFDLTFDIDTTSGPGSPPTFAAEPTDGPDAEAILGIGGSAPQRLRTVHVRLSARTPDAEPNQRWSARADKTQPLTRYYARAGTPAQGLPSSRVRTLESTVMVPNVAAADLL